MVASVEQPELGLLAHDEAKVRGKAQFHLLAGSVGLHDRLADSREELPGDGVDQFEVQRPLRREVLVQQGLGHAGGVGDVVHGRRPVAAAGEELECHRDELLTTLVRGQPARGSGLHRPCHGPHVTGRSSG